jgi:hypothetical protein
VGGRDRKDIALTVRGLRRSPGFAAGAIATLAPGLGATIAIFMSSMRRC